MAGLGRFEDALDGFAVAHLADQNDLGRLPQGGAQGVSEAGSVAMQFALMNGRAFVVVQELDGIFNGDDVVILLAIDAVEQHGQGGRLARSGGAGHENDAIAQLGHIGEVRGQTERSKIRNGGGNYAHHDRATAALDEDVDAEPGHTGQAVGYVARSVFAQGCDRLFVVADQIGGDVAGVIGSKSV